MADVFFIRPATQEDGSFLQQMLAVAADWSQPVPRPAAEIISDSMSARYIDGWRRDDDEGVVAEEGPRPIGAAWWRFFDAAHRGYGYVEDTIPELSIGVVRDNRGRGVGEALMRALIDRARTRNLAGLSLSVDPRNNALRLYQRLSFKEVGGTGGSLTMVLHLGE